MSAMLAYHSLQTPSALLTALDCCPPQLIATTGLTMPEKRVISEEHCALAERWRDRVISASKRDPVCWLVASHWYRSHSLTNLASLGRASNRGVVAQRQTVVVHCQSPQT